MKLFKTEQEKRIETLEKQQKQIQDEMNILKKEPLPYIKQIFEQERNENKYARI